MIEKKRRSVHHSRVARAGGCGGGRPHRVHRDQLVRLKERDRQVALPRALIMLGDEVVRELLDGLGRVGLQIPLEPVAAGFRGDDDVVLLEA